ncbi:MAG: hypothetical protein WKG07_10945 [Hymenobacter sp.]
MNVIANAAQSGSLVIDRGSTLDVGVLTNHNFGALPDSKVGGSGRLRVSSATATATFPGGDFGSFIQSGGGTVEYYTNATQSFTVPATAGTLTLNQYRNLWLNAVNGRTITLPTQDLRIYAQLKTGVANGATTFPGTVLVSSGTAGNLRADSLLAVQAGTLRLQGTNARTLTVDTDVRVENGATFDVLTTAAQTHALAVGGTLINNGTLDFKVGTGQVGLELYRQPGCLPDQRGHPHRPPHPHGKQGGRPPGAAEPGRDRHADDAHRQLAHADQRHTALRQAQRHAHDSRRGLALPDYRQRRPNGGCRRGYRHGGYQYYCLYECNHCLLRHLGPETGRTAARAARQPERGHGGRPGQRPGICQRRARPPFR